MPVRQATVRIDYKAIECMFSFNFSKFNIHLLVMIIFYRIHAEFQLSEPPAHPFWFTPAQFTGSVVMSRDGRNLEHFHLFVPTHRRLNVGEETLPGNLEVFVDTTT